MSVAELFDLGLCCPHCRGQLRESRVPAHRLDCASCAREYPVEYDIPDLRLHPDPYIAMDADRAKGRRLLDESGARDWRGMVDFYYRITDTVPPQQAERFLASLDRGAIRAASTLAAWERLAGGATAEGGTLLEVGCGTGPLLLAAARGRTVVGLDVAFRWLIVCRRRLEERGVRAPLVCANAESLPFREASFDVVASESTIEVTRDQNLAATEAFRVLRPGGRIYLTTPNRWSLGPDPHLGVPAGGWWPQSWLARWAGRRGALPPRRNLLSRVELGGLLHRAGFRRRRYDLPAVPAEQRRALGPMLRAAATAYDGARRTPVTRHVLFFLGPMLMATASKPSATPPPRAPAA